MAKLFKWKCKQRIFEDFRTPNCKTFENSKISDNYELN